MSDFNHLAIGQTRMSGREIFDQMKMPPVAALLGWRFLDSDTAKGWIKVGFDGKPEFLNPAGFIQGGMLAAMLDDTMGPAVLVASNGECFTSTIDMHVTFLAPAKVGKIVCEARVVQLGKTIAFMEGTLFDAEGTLLARATASARIVPMDKVLRSTVA